MSLKQNKPKLVDSHAHVQFTDYNEDRSEVIKRAIDAGIWMINSGSNLESSEQAIKLAEEHEEGVYATVGIHPSENSKLINSARNREDSERFFISDRAQTQNSKLIQNKSEKLRSLIKHPKCVAVGECGLEYFADTSEENKSLQAELFTAQINLAYEARKPLVIHCRDAYKDLYKLLKNNEKLLLPAKPALMHFFSGTIADADKFLEMGLSFSFGGAVTFPPKVGKADFISLIKSIPIEAILLETDCPYVSPDPLRGKRNEPSYVIHVAAKIAEIKEMEIEKLSEITTENALRFFAINKGK